MVTKVDLEDLLKERLKLNERFNVLKATFRIDAASDEIVIDGPVSISILMDDPDDGDIGGHACEIEDIEKTFKPIGALTVKRKYKRRGRIAERRRSANYVTPLKGHALPGAGAKITDAMVKGYKATLHARKHGGCLTDNQLDALKALEGVRTNKMTPEMRQQLQDIVADSTVETRAERNKDNGSQK